MAKTIILSYDDDPISYLRVNRTKHKNCIPEIVTGFSEAETLELYRKLQAEVAPNDRRILDAARDVCAALNENQAAGRHLGLAPDPDMLLGRLLQIARWAREYREPKAEGHHAAVFPEFPGGQLDAVAVHDNVQIIARGGDFLDSAMIHVGHASGRRLARQILAIVGPGVESEPDPELREVIGDAIAEFMVNKHHLPALLMAAGRDLGFKILETLPDAEGAVEILADGIAQAINELDGLWEKPLSAEDRAVLDWARQHVVARERDRFARSRFLHLAERLLSDPPSPAPRSDVESEPPREPCEHGRQPAVKTSPAVKITKDLLDLKERVANLERRATSNWNATRDTGAALCRRVEALERRVGKIRESRNAAAVARHQRFAEAEARLERLERWPSAGALRDLVTTEVEKAVAPIRELVHEQLDKILKTLEATKNRVDGMLAPRAASDIGPEMLRQHFENRAQELKALARLAEAPAGKTAEDLKAQGLTDGMIEAAVNAEPDQPVTTPPRPEKDVSSPEED